MKFGRIVQFITADDKPFVSPTPTQPSSTPAVSPSSGQQNSQDIEQKTNQNPSIPSKTNTTPSKKTVFDDIKVHENTVFSKLDYKLAYDLLRGKVEWTEGYTQRLPKKPNFYRFDGVHKETGDQYFILIRGDRPEAERGMYRVITQNIANKRGSGNVKYFNSSKKMLEFIERYYGIDTSEMTFDKPDVKKHISGLMQELRSGSSDCVRKVFEMEIEDEAEKKEIVERMFRAVLQDKIGIDRKIFLIKKIEKLSKRYFTVDIEDIKKQIEKKQFVYRKNKDKYKEMFDEKNPFMTRDKKVYDTVNRFLVAQDTNSKFYNQMLQEMGIEKTMVVNKLNSEVNIGDIATVISPRNFVVLKSEIANKSTDLKTLEGDGSVSIETSTGISLTEFNNYLQKMNAQNSIMMMIASEMCQSGVMATFDVVNMTDKTIKIKDIEPTMTFSANGTNNVASGTLWDSTEMRDFVKEKKLKIQQNSIKRKWIGFMEKAQLKKMSDYLRATTETFKKHENKPVKSFEYNLRMYNEPSAFWRDTTDATFRAEIDMGDVYTPTVRSYINTKVINEHYSENECIAFAFIHEQFVNNKKVWIIDEYQSDLVQQLSKLDDSPGMVTWFNPSGKSKLERLRSRVDNYYKDWYRVFFNKLIKKSKSFGVDELWLIRGQDIFQHWKDAGMFGDCDELSAEKHMKLFRRIYDNTAIEYSQHADDTEIEPIRKEYGELVKQLSNYYDMLAQINIYDILTKKYTDLTSEQQDLYNEKYNSLDEEQKKRKLEGIDINRAKAITVEIDIRELKDRIDKTMEIISVVKKKPKDLPVEIFNAKYHIIDVNKVSDDKLAVVKNRLTKYAYLPIKVCATPEELSQWGQKAYDWIVNSWTPTYLNEAKRIGEKIMSEDRQKQVGLEWFWVRQLPKEIKTDPKVLIAIRDYLRERFAMPNLDWSANVKFYIESKDKRRTIFAGDNPDPSYTDSQTSPMEENFDNRAVDPDSRLYRRQKGRGAPMGDPMDEGELKTDLPASMSVPLRTANDVVERYVIQREKQHASDPEIKEELEDKGVSENMIENTYQTRDKNLYKELT